MALPLKIVVPPRDSMSGLVSAGMITSSPTVASGSSRRHSSRRACCCRGC